MRIVVETSARHVHLCKTDLESLFGVGYKLRLKKNLTQPGQFACEEKVSVEGPRGELTASILGPLRNETQVEVSLTDARKIGISVPIRESGDLENTPGCKLKGPKGEVILGSGVIAAKRHIHLDPKTAQENNLADRETVNVKIKTSDRSVIFGDVVVRVNENFAPSMHIDTDESNAAGITGEVFGEILK